MASLILDERDQQFVLYQMLGVEEICEQPKYVDFSKETFNMIMNEAQKRADEVILPTLAEGDKEGCRLIDGQVHVPECYHRAYKLFCEGGWHGMSFPRGGRARACRRRKVCRHDWFYHNFAFIAYPFATEGAAHLIETYGTEAQKKRYLPKMVAGVWGGTMALTEPGAGTDVGNLNTRAIRQPDGTFRLQGTKLFITGGQDLMENIIQPVLARIEGDPRHQGDLDLHRAQVPRERRRHPGPANDYTSPRSRRRWGSTARPPA